MTITDRDDLTTEFAASPTLAGDLQAVLVALLELQSQAKQAHWTLVGPLFRATHLALDGRRRGPRAVRLRRRTHACSRSGPGRTYRTVAETSTLGEFPTGEVSVERAVAVVSERILAVVNIIRAVHDDVDSQDPTSADILHGILEELEKQRWMFTAQLRQLPQ